MPGDVEYALDTSHVESVELLFLSWVKSPVLVAAHHRAQNAGSVDLDLGTFREPVTAEVKFCIPSTSLVSEVNHMAIGPGL